MAIRFDLNSFLETAAQTATGLLQGQQMGIQHAEQQALQAYQMQQQAAAQQREAAMAPFSALAPHMQRFTPESQAQILGGMGRAAALPQGPGLEGLQRMLPRGSRMAGMLHGMQQPQQPQQPVAPTGPQMAGLGQTEAPEAGASFDYPGVGRLTLGSVSRERLTAIQNRYKAAKDMLTKVRPDSPVAANLRKSLQGINLNPRTEEEARDAEARLAEADLASQSGSAVVRQGFEQDVTRHEKSFNELIKPGVSPQRAVRGFIDLYDEGESLRAEGKTVGGFVPSFLVDWKDDIEAMREAISRGTPEGRQEAAEIAERMQGAIGRNLTPDQALRETQLGLSVLGKIDPSKLNDKEFVAQQLEVAGLPAFAARVRERGTAIGTGEARKEFRRLMAMIPGFKDMPAQARAELAEQIVGAARAAGEKVTLTAKDLQKYDPIALRRFALLGKQLNVFDEREQRAATAARNADELHRFRMGQLKKTGAGLDVPQTLNSLWDMLYAAKQEKKRIFTALGATEADLGTGLLDEGSEEIMKDAILAERSAQTAYDQYFNEHSAGKVKVDRPKEKPVPGPYKKPPAADIPEQNRGDAAKSAVRRGAPTSTAQAVPTGRLRAIVVNGQQIQVNPATFNEDAARRGWSRKKIQMFRSQYGF
jgi:hypothetical protein